MIVFAYTKSVDSQHQIVLAFSGNEGKLAREIQKLKMPVGE